MRSFVVSGSIGLLICGATALASCDGDDPPGPSSGTGGSASGSGGSSAGTSAGGSSGAGGSVGGTSGASGSAGAAGSASGSAGITGTGGSAGSSAGAGGTAPADAGTDAPVGDPCDSALFCEKFDGYPAVASISHQQRFGPWRAALQTGATMGLDGTHALSGTKALHVHIDDAVTAGGRLFADGAQPIFANKPTHVYGRMMLFIEPNGTSVHWTFFGVNGSAEASSPAAGRNASYIMSSLPRQGTNTFSFVYGLQAMGSDGYHDCSSQSRSPMPTSTWTCVAFEMDSVARKLRMYKDFEAAPILSVDDHGNGCVAPTSVTDPWYGPAVTQLFVGAWSFHDMNDPLDVWIDDLTVDTKPVSCPSSSR